jgi:ribose 5-phosphate isomerase RpiB
MTKPSGPLRVGIAADHGGFVLKEEDPADDYPDFVILLARAVAAGQVDRGVAICGSGVGAFSGALRHQRRLAKVRALETAARRSASSPPVGLARW